MEIGIRLHDTKKESFENRLKIAREQGFSCIHLALSKIEGLYKENTALTPGYASYIKRELAKQGLDLAVLGCYLNPANPNVQSLERITKQYENYIRFASYLGTMVGTETGAPNESYTHDKEACHSKEALETLITNIRPIVKCAESFGVTFVIEPVYRHIVWNPRVARYVLDAISSPNLKIIFDPVNLLDLDNIDKQEEIITEAIELLGEDIMMIHLKDYVIEEDKMKAVACGFGEMKYERIIEFAKSKPHIYTTLENTTPETAIFAREYIEKMESIR